LKYSGQIAAIPLDVWDRTLLRYLPLKTAKVSSMRGLRSFPGWKGVPAALTSVRRPVTELERELTMRLIEHATYQQIQKLRSKYLI
jgi:hypothetical protein